MPTAELFFFKIALAILSILLFHISFRIFSISVKQCYWKFDKDCIRSIDCSVMRIAMSIPRLLFPEDKKHLILKILVSSLQEKIEFSFQL